MILGTCVSGPWKGFGRLEAIASLDAYQITNYRFLQKFIFCLPDFRRIRESFQIRNFMANCLSRRDQKVHWIFQKRVPWGTTHFIQFFFFLILIVCLLRATMHAIDGLPNWSIFSHVRIVLKGWSFGPKLFISFLSKERIMARKCYREMDNFWSTCPKVSIKDDFKVSRSWDLHFWSSKGFWQAWSCSKSWCIPNYQLSVSFKNSSFLLPDFEEFEKKFLNREFYGQLPEQAWSNGLFDFSKSCPLGHHVFFIQMIP